MSQVELRVDIDYKCLLEWLVDRKIVKPKWQDTIRKAKDSLSKFIKDYDTENLKIKEILLSERLSYFDCKYVFTALEAEEGSSAKNVFGQYNSSSLRSCSSIIKLWEYDNAYLGESSRLLVQWVSHEYPGMKRAQTSAEKTIAELSRKIADLDKHAISCDKQHSDLCKDWGVHGNSLAELKASLVCLVNELPQLYDHVEQVFWTSNFKECVQYFTNLLDYLFSVPPLDSPSITAPQALVKDHFLSHIRHIISGSRMKAASTQSQLPVEQSPPVASENLSVDFNSGPVLDIDWSVASALSDGTFLSQDVHEIDFNITAGDIMGDTATDLDRDWMITSTAHDVGVRSHAEETPVIARGGDASVGVLARVERQGAGDGAGISSSDVMTCGLITAAEIQGLDPPPATVSLFTSAEFRERVLCELMELKAFLQQRMVEVASPGDAQAMIASMAVAESTAGSSCTVGQLLSVGVQEIQGYLRAVEEVESALQTGRLKRVAQLQESRPHLERVARTIWAPRGRAARLRAQIEDTELKREVALRTIAEAVPRIEELKKAAKRLQLNLEDSLSKLLPGRQIRLTGDINSL